MHPCCRQHFICDLFDYFIGSFYFQLKAWIYSCIHLRLYIAIFQCCFYYAVFVLQIEKDLLRTMPTNACFSTFSSVGVPKLRRVLRGLAWLYPDIGYCQGTGMVGSNLITDSLSLCCLTFGSLSIRLWGVCLIQVVSCLLLFLEEEDALWMMCALIEDLLPPSYFSSTLLGVQTDQRVLRQLIVQYLPSLDQLLQEHDIGEIQTASKISNAGYFF